jgi:tellurite resistance protein
MAGKANFTEQEWETLHKGVTGAGLLVSVSDRIFIHSYKEAGALARHLAGARKDSSSELVRELAETRGTGFGVTSSPAEVESETLEALHSAVATLESKAPDEVEAYKSFVLDVAQSVAEAAEGGSEAERAVVEKIRSALGGPAGA